MPFPELTPRIVSEFMPRDLQKTLWASFCNMRGALSSTVAHVVRAISTSPDYIQRKQRSPELPVPSHFAFGIKTKASGSSVRIYLSVTLVLGSRYSQSKVVQTTSRRAGKKGTSLSQSTSRSESDTSW